MKREKGGVFARPEPCAHHATAECNTDPDFEANVVFTP